MTPSLTSNAPLRPASATDGAGNSSAPGTPASMPELTVTVPHAPPAHQAASGPRATNVQMAPVRFELSQADDHDEENALQSMGDIFKAVQTTKDLVGLAIDGLNFNKSLLDGVLTGAGAVKPGLNQRDHKQNEKNFDQATTALTNARQGTATAAKSPTAGNDGALKDAQANEQKARDAAIHASIQLLGTVPYAKGVNAGAVATGLAGAANGLAASGASAALAAAKLGLVELGKRSTSLLPAVGVVTGAVSTGLATKDLVSRVKTHKNLAQQIKDIKAANNPARAASTELKAALDNVVHHAGASIGRAQKLGRWDIADASLGVLTSALGTAASFMTSSGIGAIVGVPLGLATAAVGAVGKIGMSLGKFIQSKVLGKRVNNQSEAVATPEKVTKELNSLRAKNKGMTEAEARVKLASTNRMFALMTFVEKLKSPASASDRNAAIRFLTDAKVPDAHLEALLLTLEDNTPVSPQHAAVAYLHKLFGFDN